MFVNIPNIKWPFILPLVLCLTCLYLTHLIPSFQSGDEFDHIERGYLLSKGIIVQPLKNNPAHNVPKVMTWEDIYRYRGETGGVINAGLYDYMVAHEGLIKDLTFKMTIKQRQAAKKIQWSKKKVYRTAPGTSIYFPMIYIPHAVGFWLGEHMGLSIDNTYFLIKYILIFCIAAALFYAFSLYPTNPLVVFLLFMPMSLYQFSSGSIDGISTALTVLAISMFLKMINTPKACSYLFLSGLVVIVCALTTSRLQAMPLWVCLFYYAFKRGDLKALLLISASLLMAILWYVYILSTKSFFSDTGNSTVETILFYTTHLNLFYDMLSTTLSNAEIRGYYLHGLIAKVGWHGGTQYFSSFFYVLTFSFGYVMALMSFSMKHFKQNWQPRLCLIIVMILSIAVIFLSMLFTYTPMSSEIVMGVQGRYFLIPLLFFTYAIGGEIKFSEGGRRKFGVGLLMFHVFMSVNELSTGLLLRYYN